MLNRFWMFAFVLLILAGPERACPGQQPAQQVAVEIEIVADSSNQLQARVQIAAGTNARDLMDTLFKMEYLDAGRKFVVGIAGFKAPPREKKFWRLEVEGAASPVGIAEIVIKRATRLRWQITPY